MAEKQQREINEKVEAIMDERKMLKDFKRRCEIDQKNRKNDKILQKIEFVAQNDNIIAENCIKKLQSEEEKVNQKMNYFPFTHGDALEEQ